MGFLLRLFTKKLPNENLTKPFYTNKTASERRDWFSRTRPWHQVNAGLIDELVEKFGDDPMFEVFTITSMELGGSEVLTEFDKMRRSGALWTERSCATPAGAKTRDVIAFLITIFRNDTRKARRHDPPTPCGLWRTG